MMEEILVCENLTMTFNDGEYIVHALKNVSFSLHKNEVLGIIGESGSGKSTIAKLITGLYQPTGGNIFLDGRSIGPPETAGAERSVYQSADGISGCCRLFQSAEENR